MLGVVYAKKDGASRNVSANRFANTSVYPTSGSRDKVGHNKNVPNAWDSSLGVSSNFTIRVADMLDAVKEKFSDVLSADVVFTLGIERKAGEFTPMLKYSLNAAELNERYMAAVQNGTAEDQQKLVDEAAKNAGYSVLMYHGAKDGGGFNTFRDWSYFTENEGYAARYTK